MATPDFRMLLRNPLHLLAFGFGSGLAPQAPGTWGTALGLLIYLGLTWMLVLEPWTWALLTAVAFALGIPLCQRVSAELGGHDHGGIVWDEIVGIWVACIALPSGWPWLLAAFVLFRALDIVKPWPIGWLDQRVRGGVGIMLDDLVAGLVTLAVLQAANTLLSELWPGL